MRTYIPIKLAGGGGVPQNPTRDARPHSRMKSIYHQRPRRSPRPGLTQPRLSPPPPPPASSPSAPNTPPIRGQTCMWAHTHANEYVCWYALYAEKGDHLPAKRPETPVELRGYYASSGRSSGTGGSSGGGGGGGGGDGGGARSGSFFPSNGKAGLF